MNPAIRVHNLSLVAGGKILLDHLTLPIPAGEITLILGPNGAGKTLLLRCLAGLLTPQTGEILDGADIPLLSKPKAQTARLLHWMPVSESLPFDFTVHAVVLMGRYPYHQGFPGKNDSMLARAALERMGMQKFAERIYNDLSRGEQVRVDIARALAAATPILLMDEPFANLDIDASLHLIALLQELRQEGKTIILSHHDLYTARDLGTHLIFLRQGQLIAEGSCKTLFTPENIHRTFNVIVELRDTPETDQQFVRFTLPPDTYA